MDKNALAKQLRKTADEIIDKDILLADACYKISDYLFEKENSIHGELSFRDFGSRYTLRTRVRLLTNILIQLTELYESSISANQLSYVNDLIDKVEVGYLEEKNDSDYAQKLRDDGYKLSANDSEFSLQVRISNLLQELMPGGSWVAE